MVDPARIIRLMVFLFSVPLTALCLSDHARVSVLTFEPGIPYYTIFGHTAIRITDSAMKTDRVYNFGTFDFSTPHFYLKFMKGNLMYYLTVDDFDDCLFYWLREERKIHEQVLDLNRREKQVLFRQLEKCYHSKDRYYHYDFFYNNCATKVRDAVFYALERPVSFDTGQYGCKTFRQRLKPYLAGRYWIDLGVNLALGKEADKPAGAWNTMFLPSYIMSILDDSTLGAEKHILLDASAGKKHRFNYSATVALVITALLIILSFVKATRKIVFFLVLSVIGFNGLFLFIISMISENTGFLTNLNCCWMVPALFVMLIRTKRVNDPVKILYCALLLLIILFWNRLPQALSVTFIPWIIALMVVLAMDLRVVNKVHSPRSTVHSKS